MTVPGYLPGVNPSLQHREGGPRSLVDSLSGGDGAEGAGRLQLIELHQVPLQYWQSSHQHMHVRQLPGGVRGNTQRIIRNRAWSLHRDDYSFCSYQPAWKTHSSEGIEFTTLMSHPYSNISAKSRKYVLVFSQFV